MLIKNQLFLYSPVKHISPYFINTTACHKKRDHFTIKYAIERINNLSLSPSLLRLDMITQ